MSKRLGISMAAMLLIASLGLIAACDRSEERSPQQQTSDPIMARGTMDAVYSSDHLYTCPMHSEVVSSDPAATCPLCKMKLVEMEEGSMRKLRDADLRGCPMDPIVVPAMAEAMSCPVCGMALEPIGQGHGHHDDGGHHGDADHQGHAGHHGQ